MKWNQRLGQTVRHLPVRYRGRHQECPLLLQVRMQFLARVSHLLLASDMSTRSWGST